MQMGGTVLWGDLSPQSQVVGNFRLRKLSTTDPVRGTGGKAFPPSPTPNFDAKTGPTYNNKSLNLEIGR
jgi:hypothetical protein